jgi:phosphoglycerate dehydrogenase-like enzyme
MLKVAILDDYAHVALESADWGQLAGLAEIKVFDRHLSEDEAAQALRPFDVLCTMRERLALPRTLLERLPNLKLITMVGMRLANLDMQAATDCGVLVVPSNFRNAPGSGYAEATPEFAFGLIIATVRHIAAEDRRMREGGWQSTIGMVLAGRTLGLLGLGRIGRRMAEYARVFHMEVIAWSQNLTDETAAAAGARRVDKEALFRESDVLSIHVQLSGRTRGLVGAGDLGLMKPEAYLINTSRAPIVDTGALVEALRAGRLAGAGLDVYDVEPPAAADPLRTLENVTHTPHLGYATRETMRVFYAGAPQAVADFARGAPLRLANPDALQHAKHRK